MLVSAPKPGQKPVVTVDAKALGRKKTLKGMEVHIISAVLDATEQSPKVEVEAEEVRWDRYW